MYWIVLANSSVYRIYLYDKKAPKAPQLTLLKEEYHPESKLKISELMTDRPGRYKAMNEPRSAYESHVNPKEDEIEHFLRNLVHELEVGRVANQYEKIILIAPARINGILAKHINKNIKHLIIDHLKKDYTHLKEHELRKFLLEQWEELI